MKILLDENLPHRLRGMLEPHEVSTVRFRGWAGLQNGALLRAAEESGVDAFLTGDQTLSYEQNLRDRRIAIVVLSAIELEILRSHIPAILAAIETATPGSLQVVECG